MTAAAAALRASSSSTSKATVGDWSLPIAIAIAIAAHAALLLGLGITPPPPGPSPTQTLELMVVTQPALESPTAVPALVSAQTDRTGETQALLPEVAPVGAATVGSSADQPTEPSEQSQPTETAEQGLTAATQPQRPQPPERAEPSVPALEALPAHRAPATPVTAASVDLEAEPEPETAPATDPSVAAPAAVERERPQRPAISAADIFASRNAEMANLAARIEEQSQAYANRTRRKAISTATREYIYANYMEAWRRKVERIGNLNYPREARELGLFGSLILHVAVRSDGSLEGIRVVRSSGHEVLDQAAVRIVELAAPFAPFPPNIKRETDVLDITRTWQFQRNHELSWGN